MTQDCDVITEQLQHMSEATIKATGAVSCTIIVGFSDDAEYPILSIIGTKLGPDGEARLTDYQDAIKKLVVVVADIINKSSHGELDLMMKIGENIEPIRSAYGKTH